MCPCWGLLLCPYKYKFGFDCRADFQSHAVRWLKLTLGCLALLVGPMAAQSCSRLSTSREQRHLQVHVTPVKVSAAFKFGCAQAWDSSVILDLGCWTLISRLQHPCPALLKWYISFSPQFFTFSPQKYKNNNNHFFPRPPVFFLISVTTALTKP